MAELTGVDLSTHLISILAEFRATETIYGYPKRKFYLGYPGLDFSVDFHDRRAATVLGPASGPHTQLAQNILLSFLGGARIMELKTVQIKDQLEIPRPCIDVRNIGFNVEWSQELRLEESLREYQIAWILLKFLEELELLGIPKGDPFYQTVFDISVGYDLAGISSQPVHDWLERIINAEEDIARLLEELPDSFGHLKKMKIDPHIAGSATLSTFHGCPRDEIEAIVQHLIREHGLHVIVKLNPTLAGYDYVEKTLREDLGYRHIELDRQAFEEDLQFDDAIAMLKRLQVFGEQHGKRVGAKFTNTLVVKNTENIFKDEVMYLSGAPLHVISMNLMHRVRSAMGEDFHCSFSAGISKHNFVDAVLCNLRPVTTCTDLLKTGGYTRLADYMKNLKTAMEKAGASDLEEFIIQSAPEGHRGDVHQAGAANAARIVPTLAENPRHHYSMNQKPPRKLDSHLELFDCITCNKCIPVCPNAANFSIPAGKQEIAAVQLRYQDEEFVAEETGVFRLEQEHQIANLADFCNECGDCDTYCPEHGGPFIEKPRFFSSEETYRQFPDHDGFYFVDPFCLKGRIKGREYLLAVNPTTKVYLFQNGQVECLFEEDHQFISAIETGEIAAGETIDLQPYYSMRVLLDGMLRSPENYPVVLLRQAK